MNDVAFDTIALLMTDVQGSTVLWESETEATRVSMRELDRMVAETVNRHGGRLVKERGEGDSHFIVADTVGVVARIATDLQLAVAGGSWATTRPLNMRMGIHVGVVEVRDGDFYGPVVNRCARIRSAGHGGQILLSQAAHALLVDQAAPFSFRDLSVHRLKDLERPEHIYQLDVSGLAAEFPPLNSLDLSPNNLPVQLNSFIGRTKETDQVGDLLREYRLVSLLGPGGVGKSRLAVHVAGEVIEGFPDGVWFVELAPVNDPTLVASTIRESLSLRGDPHDEVGQIVKSIGSSKVLLILDNCEHLVDEVASIVPTLLSRCPNLRLVITSREALGVPGEGVFRVPSLATEGESDLTAPAVALFVDRAKAHGTFELNDENLIWVAQVCKRLDGIPFAIELAAARVKVLSPKQIAERLDDRFRLLTASGRGALPRHQTLKALIDWSYDLLAERERTALKELSVFSGSFGLIAASSICEHAGDEYEALDLITGLVEKSLVQVLEGRVEPRYRLLESIRQYCREKLDLDMLVEIEKRHFEHFLGFAKAQAALLLGSKQSEALRALEEEHDNLRAALDRPTSSEEEIEKVRVLAGTLARFWYLRGHYIEGRQRFARLLVGVPQPTEGWAKCLSGDGILAWRMAHFEEAKKLHEQALSIRRQQNDLAGQGDSLSNLGLVAIESGNYDEAKAHLSESLSIREQLGDKFGQANSLNNLGVASWRSGKLDEAYEFYSKCLTLRESLGDQLGRADTLHNLGLIARTKGDYDEALVKFEAALQIHREGQGVSAQIIVLDNLALLHLLRGEVSLSRSCCRESRELSKRAADSIGVARAELYEASCDLEEGRFEDAKGVYQALIAAKTSELLSSALYGMAGVAHAEGDLVRAGELLSESDRAGTEVGSIRAQIPFCDRIFQPRG